MSMNWESTLRKKRTAGITKWGKKTLDEIMSDGEKRTIKEIMDEMWNKVEEYNMESRFITRGRLTGRGIPTKGEIIHYLRQHKSGVFDIYTGAPRVRITSTTERRWWKE